MDYSNVTPSNETSDSVDFSPNDGRELRRRLLVKRVVKLRELGLSSRGIAAKIGATHPFVRDVLRRVDERGVANLALELDDIWKPTAPTPERCPTCGRVSLPPCLACSLRRNGERVCQDVAVDFRDFDVDLTPDEYERYVAVREAKKARNEKRSAFWGRD